MVKIKYILIAVLSLTFLSGNVSGEKQPETKQKTIKMWLIGDSTVADYSKEDNYKSKKYPITGWGQVFQSFVSGSNLQAIKNFLIADNVIIDDRAKGGRSTRTFFQEGRWREVYNDMQPGDFVLMQFGHNDASVQKTERYVNEEGYKEFLRLFISQTRQKNGTPILVTPVARNYPWENDTLKNIHGNYPQCMFEIAEETQTLLIDLNKRSMEYFTAKGRDYVKTNYFMNLPAGKYEAYPDGQNDNTHFQPEGAKAVAELVFEGLKDLANHTQTEE
ncbi:rhamnogalacturonan acetylesterase [uncultured Draconibacterium sp.]|uniref:rhamnogalacturonan acetylesterase n=1 Tax=uncultured Draconibacterium sp. TaxID=1573823 RepID=UPI003216560E